MAYHEYTTPNGKLVIRHYNGRRVPVQDQPDYWDNAEYWQAQARQAAGELVDILGSQEAYLQWCEENLPDEPVNYRKLTGMIRAAIEQAGGDRDLSILSS